MAEQSAAPPLGRYLKMKEVVRETSLHRATIYRRVAAGTFPPPRELGPRRVAWPESVIENWKRQQPERAPP